MPTSALDQVLNDESLVSHFQPIISVKKKRIIGAEALARASQGGSRISPLNLFHWAAQEGRLLELDRLCRRRAIEGFSEIAAMDPELLLFINFEVSVLDQASHGTGALLALVQEMGLRPGNIVIEINESNVKDPATLQSFVDNHKEDGFLIAIDDLGVGHSNLQRLAMLKPDILKLDRSLIQGLNEDFFKREIFKSLVSLARNIGALVLAEGVETESEVSTCMGLGADLFQGFYYSPGVDVSEWGPGELAEVIEYSASGYKESIVGDMLRRRQESVKYRALLMDLVAKLTAGDERSFFALLNGTLVESGQVESLYVLDDAGIQITDTVTIHTQLRRTRGSLFLPSTTGEDHSVKDYFYALKDAGLSRFITEHYISLSSGNLCRTHSCAFKANSGKSYVLCIDVKAD
jgi:EAL domain-containing protein (putative c-di-GMP-specific phosphodiesterase class I)